MAALPDGGIIAAGATDHFPHQAWLFRFDASGKLLLERPIAASEDRWGLNIAMLPNGGFAVAGSLALERGTSDRKAWARRFDAGANAIWERIYDSKGLGASAITALPDGGFALAGGTARGRFAMYDAWIARLDANGDLLWEETYGGMGEDLAASIAVTPDGSLAIGGITQQAYGFFWPQAWIFTVPVEQQQPKPK
jgi:hypothetical protein